MSDRLSLVKFLTGDKKARVRVLPAMNAMKSHYVTMDEGYVARPERDFAKEMTELLANSERLLAHFR